jgi:hypothetical protein
MLYIKVAVTIQKAFEMLDQLSPADRQYVLSIEHHRLVEERRHQILNSGLEAENDFKKGVLVAHSDVLSLMKALHE